MITQVFPDEFHLHTLDHLLSAVTRLNPHVNVKNIVIGLMDRLSSYASREEEQQTPEQRQEVEEEATTRLLEKLSVSKASKTDTPADQPNGQRPDTPSAEGDKGKDEAAEEENKPESQATPDEEQSNEPNGVGKHTGIPENVKLFEIFHEQVMNLVSMQRLPIQDITALLVSLANLAL